MQLLTFNIWGGRVREPLFNFIKKHQDIDIFCFQEIYNNAPDKGTDDEREASLDLLKKLQELLPDHQSFFSPSIRDIFGNAIFVKKEIKVLDKGVITIHDVENYCGRGNNHSRNMQWIKCSIDGKTCSVFNVHGLSNGKDKIDTSDRIEQSKKIKKFIEKVDTPKIVCGDFNLNPDTESISIVEEGMHNLIKSFEIKSTRTNYYDKESKFADYVFVSPDVKVKEFKVLPDTVSDHFPLFLNFK